MTDVKIVNFPETKVAVIEHLGPPETLMASVKKLIDWRIENGMAPEKHRTYGIHYNDSRTISPSEYRVDLAISVDSEVPVNKYGVVNKVIPEVRCAVARHLGSRENVKAAEYIY